MGFFNFPARDRVLYDKIANGTATDAGPLDGNEIVTLSRGNGLVQTTLTKLSQWLGNGNTGGGGGVANPMTLDTDQTVTGAKTFDGDVVLTRRPTVGGNVPYDTGNLPNPMTLDTDQAVTGAKTFSKNVSVGTASASSILDVGGAGTTGSAVDLHSVGGAGNDYDARIASSGGVAGTVGKGNLAYTADTHTFNGSLILLPVTPSLTDSSLQGATTEFVASNLNLRLPSGKNRFRNGNCLVAQRASVSATVGTVFGGPDRYQAVNNSAGGAFTQAQYTMTLPDGSTRLGIKLTATSTMTDAAGSKYWGGISQVIEAADCFDMMLKPGFLSFWFDAAVAGTYAISIRNVPATFTFLTSFVAVAGVQRIAVPIPVLPLSLGIPVTNAGGLVCNIGAVNSGTFVGTGNANAWQSGVFTNVSGVVNWGGAVNRYIGATELSLITGPIDLPFEREGLDETTRKCQRYYTFGQTGWDTPANAGSVTLGQWHNFPVEMRVAPTMLLGTPSENVNVSGAANLGPINTKNYRIYANSIAAGACYYTNTYTAAADL
jgi:hypothetical protein